MDCRITISGRKTWNDNNNLYNSRPSSVNINLLRNGELYKSAEANIANGWMYEFACLPVWQNSSQKYIYRIEEPIVPDGYISERNGYDILNTLNEITITGTKTWNDNNNETGDRPEVITVNLLQNGQPFRETELTSPPDNEDTAEFSFSNVPVFDRNGNPFIYTVDEDDLPNYIRTVDGFDIVNMFAAFKFSFFKTNVATAMAVQDAVFELRDNMGLIGTSSSDPEGLVSFSGLQPGVYQMMETLPPVGYMSDTTVYQVVVPSDGTITIDGLPVSDFSAKNTPKISISGMKVWDDNGNPDNTRPSMITVNLYRDGSLYRQTALLTAESETAFIFNDLPQYGPDGSEYTYTVKEAMIADGYDMSVIGARIENKIRSLTIAVAGSDKDGKTLFYFYLANQAYGSSFTYHAPKIPGYTALEPTVLMVTRLTQDVEHYFNYE